ncbi:MAG: hypothetical protein QFF03_02550 [Pseudomonadota bacterium]|nr:hypothetical protein [Pseudomonadota bacterium]
MPNKLSRLCELVASIARMPVARLDFHLAINPDDVGKMHRHFTRRHPRYVVFQNKSLGAALVDLNKFATRDAYLATIKGRNSGEHLARKAKAKGYLVVEIDRNRFIDDIHAINTSVEVRQGRTMDAAYRDKVLHFNHDKNYKYYGVINPAGKLVAYGDLGLYGNFVAFNRVIGLRNNDGIMHLMVTEIICHMIEAHQVRYVMYDTCFGASAGLLGFKKMLGFEPYRAKYTLQ